jgi:hypothetical protein
VLGVRKKSVSSIVDPKGEWAAAIGAAFVAFGSIEHTTVVCLREIPADSIWRFSKSLNLVPRVDLLLELLEPYRHQECLTLAEKLRRVKELAHTRNLIAHNPLVLQMHEDGQGNRIFGSAITAIRKEGHLISLPEAQEFATTCEELAFELVGVSINAFKAMGRMAKA